MKHERSLRTAGVVLLVLITLAAAHIAAATGYTLTDLGALGGPQSSAVAMNNLGQVVGQADTGGGLQHAVLYDGTGAHDLGTLGGGTSSAYRITQNGTVLGNADTGGVDQFGNPVSRPFVYNGSGMHDMTLGGASSTINAVTQDGRAAGDADTTAIAADGSPIQHAFLFDATGVHDLGDLGTPGGPAVPSHANAVNASGQVAGQAQTATGGAHAVLFSGGVKRDLGTLGGTNSFAADINDAGQIAGSSDTAAVDADGLPISHAFLYSGGVMTDLGAPAGGSSFAYKITPSGVVIGQTYDPASGATLAFVHDSGGRHALTLGGLNSTALDANAAGQVVGQAQLANGDIHAFLWDGGGIHDLGTLGGNSSSAGRITAAGVIAGQALTATGLSHAFVYDATGMHEVTLGGRSGFITDINASGQAVGSEYTTDVAHYRAFLFDSNGTQDLGTLGGVYAYASAINDNGQVSGTSTNQGGANRAFIARGAGGPVASDQTVATTQGTSVSFVLNASDPNGDPLSYTIASAPLHGALQGTAPNLTYAPNSLFSGTDAFSYSVSDGRGGTASATVTLTVASVNHPPVLTTGEKTVTVGEGRKAANSGTWSDVDGDDVSLSASAGTVTRGAGSSWSWSFNTSDGPAQSQTVTVTGNDGHGGRGSVSFALVVNNVAPAVSITGPAAGATATPSETLTFLGSFSDPAGNTDGPFLVKWVPTRSGASPSTLLVPDSEVSAQPDGSRRVTSPRTFAALGLGPGTYAVKLSVTDKDGGEGHATTLTGGQAASVVIVEHSTARVAGSGWINSPAGAYGAKEHLTGKATLQVSARYAKGSTRPGGSASFTFGPLHFRAASLDAFSVSGARAQIRGAGTLNGASGYQFLITAVDGKMAGDGRHRFRIKILTRQGTVVYDNQRGAADNAPLADGDSVYGGAIKITK